MFLFLGNSNLGPPITALGSKLKLNLKLHKKCYRYIQFYWLSVVHHAFNMHKLNHTQSDTNLPEIRWMQCVNSVCVISNWHYFPVKTNQLISHVNNQRHSVTVPWCLNFSCCFWRLFHGSFFTNLSPTSGWLSLLTLPESCLFFFLLLSISHKTQQVFEWWAK